MTDSEQSNQVAVRKQSSIRWNNKPWMVWRYIEKWAVETLQTDGLDMSLFLMESALKYMKDPELYKKSKENCTSEDSSHPPYPSCVSTTLPMMDPVEAGIIVDGTSSDKSAWENSWTC